MLRSWRHVPSPLARIQLSHVTTYASRHYVTTETAFCVFHFLQRFSPEWPIRTCSKITVVLLLCTDNGNRSYRNVCNMPFVSFALAVIFIIKCMSWLLMKFSFIQLVRFRGDNTRVFQQISINLNMTFGHAACQLLCRYMQTTPAASCVCWIVRIATSESGERTCGRSCLKCTW